MSPNSYISIHQYFNDYFWQRKKEFPDFSYDIWSAELGFKSRSYLKMVCDGQRQATNKLIEIFSKRNNLSLLQESHLVSIGLYQKATVKVEKKIYLEKIFETLEATPQNLEVHNYLKFLSHLDLPILQLILGFNDGPKTADGLAHYLEEPVESIQSRLELLKQLGLAESQYAEGKKIWIAKSKAFHVSDKYLDEALQIYHEETLKEALQTIRQKDVIKKFQTIYLPVADQSFQELTEDIDIFLNKMRHKYSSQNLKEKKIFKINLNTYAVTKKL